MNDDRFLLETQDVHKTFGSSRRPVNAVAGVDLALIRGRPIGIAGESGSGKTTLLRLLLGLESPSAGTVLHEGRDVASLSGPDRKSYRRAVQAVFQDPGASFDPRARIWKTVTEPAWMSERLTRAQRRALAGDLLTSVDLPARFAESHPHELSGGERQRVAIARALSSHPDVVVLDEPVTALDVSVRGSIINLLLDRADLATYVVVSHDLTVIHHLADHLLVMFRGIVVEQGPTTTLLAEPRHPYTQLLVESSTNPLYQPPIDSDDTPPHGACPYLYRCPIAIDACQVLPPPTGSGHVTRCHRVGASSAGNPVAPPSRSLAHKENPR